MEGISNVTNIPNQQKYNSCIDCVVYCVSVTLLYHQNVSQANQTYGLMALQLALQGEVKKS